LSDIVDGWRRRELWEMMALQDIRQRYQRSVIGPFWITLSLGVMIGVLGPLYGTIFMSGFDDPVNAAIAGTAADALGAIGTRRFSYRAPHPEADDPSRLR
jgi:ABC-type polysaccharide/polyol phosphate export permease